jgi:hypothetical protein
VSGLQVLCKFPKSLILKAFIIEKFLDTPPLPLLTFAQKVLTVLPPLELFSLERKSHLLPGGFFVLRFSPPQRANSPRRHGGAEKIRDNQFKSDFNPLTEVIPSERSESRDLHLLYA